MSIEDNKTPKNTITIHINLNCFDFNPPCQPKQPFATYAAAKGAVIADVIPAANKPNAKKYLAK